MYLLTSESVTRKSVLRQSKFHNPQHTLSAYIQFAKANVITSVFNITDTYLLSQNNLQEKLETILNLVK